MRIVLTMTNPAGQRQTATLDVTGMNISESSDIEISNVPLAEPMLVTHINFDIYPTEEGPDEQDR